MSRLRPRVPRWLSVLALLSATVCPAGSDAQSPASFRITHTVDKGAPTHVSITGRVFNDARADAIDVYVTAEALDGAGKIVASGVSYVGAVSAGSSAAFIIKVPTAKPAASFRVLVTSFRFGFANQS
jgi:hypothetical protein